MIYFTIICNLRPLIEQFVIDEFIYDFGHGGRAQLHTERYLFIYIYIYPLRAESRVTVALNVQSANLSAHERRQLKNKTQLQ